jgi:hypothetical protein
LTISGLSLGRSHEKPSRLQNGQGAAESSAREGQQSPREDRSTDKIHTQRGKSALGTPRAIVGA